MCLWTFASCGWFQKLESYIYCIFGDGWEFRNLFFFPDSHFLNRVLILPKDTVDSLFPEWSEQGVHFQYEVFPTPSDIKCTAGLIPRSILLFFWLGGMRQDSSKEVECPVKMQSFQGIQLASTLEEMLGESAERWDDWKQQQEEKPGVFQELSQDICPMSK